MAMFTYFVIGGVFGAVLFESEAISWFRIQEMFRFEAFQMYGIIATAIVVTGLSVALIKRLQLRDAGGSPIALPPKTLGSGVRYGVAARSSASGGR